MKYDFETNWENSFKDFLQQSEYFKDIPIYTLFSEDEQVLPCINLKVDQITRYNSQRNSQGDYNAYTGKLTIMLLRESRKDIESSLGKFRDVFKNSTRLTETDFYVLNEIFEESQDRRVEQESEIYCDVDEIIFSFVFFVKE